MEVGKEKIKRSHAISSNRLAAHLRTRLVAPTDARRSGTCHRPCIFQRDDVIRRAHVSRMREQQEATAPKRPLVGLRVSFLPRV